MQMGKATVGIYIRTVCEDGIKRRILRIAEERIKVALN